LRRPQKLQEISGSGPAGRHRLRCHRRPGTRARLCHRPARRRRQERLRPVLAHRLLDPGGCAKDPAGCKCDKDLLPKEVCEPPGPGCPGAAAGWPKPSGEKITVAADALFDFNKAVLRPEGKAKLDEAGRQVQGHQARSDPRRRSHRPHRFRLPTTRSCPRSALPPVKEYLVPRASKPTASTPKARARSSRSPATSARATPRPRSDRLPAAGSSRRHRSHRHQVIRRCFTKSPARQGFFFCLLPQLF
jgi:hypothetical protein